MKRNILLFVTTIFCLLSRAEIIEQQEGINMSNSQREYMMIPTINLQRLSLISLSNTIAYNCEDSILELVTPPVGNQGSQNSCTAWACAYTAASIVTYSLVQD